MRDGKDADTSGIDGRNRISFGSGEYQKGFFKNFSKTEQGYGEHTLTSKKQYSNVNLTDGFLLDCRDYKVGEKVTFSYDIMYTEWNFPTGSDRSEFWIGQRYTNSTDSSAIGAWRAVTMHNLPVVGEGGCKLGAWYHVEKTMTIPEQADESVGTTASIQFYNSSAEKEAKITFRMKNVKLEYGEKATDWSPAPEDNISSIKTLETIARKNTLDIETKVGKADFFKVINPDTGEDEKQTISEFMSTSTQNMYGFKREVKQQYDSLELGGVNLFVQNTTIQGKYLSSENVEIKDSACTIITPNTSWQRAITTFTVTDKTNSYYYISIVPTIYNQLSKNANFWVDGIMVEEVESLNSEPNEFTNSAKATIIDGNSILTDSITADKLTANSITAEKIMADALKSKNYVVGESGSFLNLADGSFDSKYLKWDNAGKVIAKDITVVGGSINVNDKFIVNNDGIATLQGATVVGNITAESGKIGKFNLDNLALVTGDTDVTCAGLGGSSQAFWAGSLIMDNAPFRVGYDGKLYASDADISGIINSINGNIGGWKIERNRIYSLEKDNVLNSSGDTIAKTEYSLSLFSKNDDVPMIILDKIWNDNINLSDNSETKIEIGDDRIKLSFKAEIPSQDESGNDTIEINASNGIECVWTRTTSEGTDITRTSYAANGIIFNDSSQLSSVKSCCAGLVAHYWNSNNTSCGTKKDNYVKLTSFSNGTEGKLSELYYKKSNYQIAISRNGVYSFQTRLAINSPTANKRVEVVLFKNGSRYAAYSASYATPVDYTLGQLNNYILYLSEGDTIDFRIAPIDGYSVNVNMVDILIYALDYDDKYS